MPLNLENKYGATAIREAIRLDLINVVKYFIEEQKIPVDQMDGGYSLLLFAVAGGNLETIRYFVEKQKVTLDQKSEEGHSTLRIAIQRYDLNPERFRPLIAYLLDHGASTKDMDFEESRQLVIDLSNTKISQFCAQYVFTDNIFHLLKGLIDNPSAFENLKMPVKVKDKMGIFILPGKDVKNILCNELEMLLDNYSKQICFYSDKINELAQIYNGLVENINDNQNDDFLLSKSGKEKLFTFIFNLRQLNNHIPRQSINGNWTLSDIEIQPPVLMEIMKQDIDELMLKLMKLKKGRVVTGVTYQGIFALVHPKEVKSDSMQLTL